MVVGRVQSGVVKQGIWELSRIKTVRVEQRGGYRQASNALLCVGHKGYSLLFNNCEQFSEKCHDKHFRLGQVGKATGGGGFGVGHAIECNKKSINAKPTSGGSATGGGGGGAVIGKTVALATGVAATTATVGYVAYKSTLAYLAYRVAIRFLW